VRKFLKILCILFIVVISHQHVNAQVVFEMHTSAPNNTVCRNVPLTLYMTPSQNIRFIFQYSIDGGLNWNAYTTLPSDVYAGNTVSQSNISLTTNTIFRVYYTTDWSINSLPNTIDSYTISITVNQLPSITPISSSTTTVCQNSDLTFSDATSSGVWTSSNSTIASVGSSTGIVHGVSQGSAFIKYIITDPVTACTNQDTKLVTVNPTPMISSYSDAICSGVQYTKVPSGFVPSGTTFNWATPTTNASNVGDLTGMAAAGTSTQTTVNALLTNNTSSVIAATYSITATAGACASVPFNLILSVTPKPYIADRTVQACSGAAFNDAPSNNGIDIVPSNTKYTWASPTAVSNVSGYASGSNQSNFNGTLTNSTNEVLSVIYTISTSNAGCPGTTYTTTVNVNPTPIITAKATTICSNATFTIPINNGSGNIVPVSTTYSWAAPIVSGINGLQSGTNTSTVTGILSNTTSSTISNIIYRVTPTSGSPTIGYCSGPVFSVTVTVNPLPIIASAGPTQTGSGSAFNFPIGKAGDLIPVGTTYFWAMPSVQSGITGGAASGTPTPTSLTGTLNNPTGTYLDAIYTIIPSFANCAGNSFTYTVRVYPKPIVGLKQATICSGQSFGPILLTDGVGGDVIPNGTTYSWNAPIVAGITGTATGTAAGTISGTLNNTTNFPITVIYVVTPFANPQAGDPFNVSVIVNPLPIASISITESSGLYPNDKIICNDVNASFAAVPVVGSLTDYSYAWNVPAGAAMPGSAASSFTSNIAGTYGLTLTNTNTGCTSAVLTTTSLTVNPIPTVGPIVGANNVCVNSSITLSTSLVSGGSGVYSYYYWYDNNVLAAPPLSSATVLVTGNIAGDGLINYKVQDNLGCYSALSPTFTLHVNALPLAPTANSVNQPYDGLLHTGAALAANPASEQIDWYQNNTGIVTSSAPSATNVGPTVTSYASARNSTTGCVSATRTSVSVTITQKGLTIIANDFIKTYDRIAFTGGNGVNYNGFVNGENESVLTGTLTYAGTAQNAMNAGTYSILPAGLSSSNYAISMIAGKLIINKKGLTITGAIIQNKVYDATDIANMNAGSLLGVIAADIPNITLNRIAKFPSKNVGANLIITSFSTIAGTAAANYLLDPAINVTANITPKHIDAIGIVTANKVYDGTTVASVSGGAFNTFIAPGTGTSIDKTPYIGDQIQLLPTGYFVNKDVGNNVAIVSTSTISGADMNNYILDAPILTSRNIIPKSLNMTGLSVPNSKIYDATTNAVVAGTPSLLISEAPGAGNVNDGIAYSNDIVSIAGNAIGTFNSKDVATASSVSFSGLILSGANANNYTLTIQSAVASSILPKKLSMFGLSVPSSKVYDGTTNSIVNGTPQLQNAVAVNSGNVLDGKPYIGDNVTIAGNVIGNYNSKDVASASYVQYSGLNLSGLQASNYNLQIQANDASVITPFNIKVVANAQSKFYGDLDPVLNYVNDPLIGGDIFTGTLARVVGEDVGIYQINIGTLSLGNNYTINYTPNQLTILPAAIKIQPNPVVRTYGDLPLPNIFTTSNFQVTGLKNGESIGLVTLSLPSGIGSGNAMKDPAGTYANVVQASNPQSGTVNLANYQITLLPTDIVVDKYEIYISADDKQKRMTQVDPPLTYLLSRPLVAGDSLSGLLTRVAGEEVGFYPILQGTLQISSSNNYAITYVPGNLEIQTIERILVVPNAFTPNNDGLNDVLKIIHNSTVVSINYFKIFNRAGNQIFETRNLNDGWDGKLNGSVTDADAYYWVVEYNTWDNKVFKTKGSFILIK